MDYTHDTKYRAYEYIRHNIAGTRVPNPIIAQKPFSEKIWRSHEFKFRAIYEVFNNCYAHVDICYNDTRSFLPTSERIEGEDRGWNKDGTSMELSGEALERYYLNKYSPAYFQGSNITFTCGLSFGF